MPFPAHIETCLVGSSLLALLDARIAQFTLCSKADVASAVARGFRLGERIGRECQALQVGKSLRGLPMVPTA